MLKHHAYNIDSVGLSWAHPERIAMQTVNIHEAKTHLSRFVDQAAAGDEIVIARAGRPVARLVALAPAKSQPRPLGLGNDRFTLPKNFDSLHASEIQQMFEATP